MDLDDIEDDILNEFVDNIIDSDATVAPKKLHTENNQPSKEHLEVLLKYFGHKSFKPMQWEIISAIINDRRDICAVMSTGYGKSLCYQYPSTFLGGVTLVISPLIALMEDQVLSLQVANIPACLLGSAQKNHKKVIDEIFKNKYSLVYLTPEFCCGDYGMEMLNKMAKEVSVVLVAIDEAHCISSWGHDFRPQYRKLNVLRDIFTGAPIIAVTATATPKVKEDIVNNLNLREPLCVCSGFNRPNIYFEVNFKSCNVHNDLTKVMNYENSALKFDGPTIIYCITRKETEEVADVLKSQGVKCRPYHAGLTMKAREEAHELFVKDKIDVIVATIAFGMGIDKPDIRNVIHLGCSKSLENYYQEVGRAGRDGQPAKCVTFYSRGDFAIHRHLNSLSPGNDKQKEASLKMMENYLGTLKCRREFILDYFEDKVEKFDKPRHACCDNCSKKLCDSRSDYEKYEGVDENGNYDFTSHGRLFLKVVSIFDSVYYGISTYISFLRGLKSSKFAENKRKHPLYGCGREKPESWWQAIGKILMREEYLGEQRQKTKTGFSYNAVLLTNKGRTMIVSDDKILLPPPSDVLNMLKLKTPKEPRWISALPIGALPIRALPSTSTHSLEDVIETQKELDERMALYQKLLNERTEIAFQLDCMPYMVASNAALMVMSKHKPKTLDDLRRLNLDGFAEAKIIKFGDKFLKIITGNADTRPQNKVSIKDILVKNPLPDVFTSLTAQVSCTMFQSGLAMGEIAEKRGISPRTVASHLISGMKVGQPIKMIELGVTEELRDVIIKIYRKFCKTGFTAVKLKMMKEECPPEITYDHIHAVLAYLEVRHHLKALDLLYKEFEDFEFDDVKNEVCEVDEDSKVDLDAQDTQDWREVFKCNVDKDVKSSKTQITETCESPAKKLKREEDVFDSLEIDAKSSKTHILETCKSPAKKLTTEEDVFDSMDIDFDSILEDPPRQYSSESNIVKEEDTKSNLPSQECSVQPTGDGRSKKKDKLPPWLIRKKIN